MQKNVHGFMVIFPVDSGFEGVQSRFATFGQLDRTKTSLQIQG